MSGEDITARDLNKSDIISQRAEHTVDINKLKAKLREEEQKQKKGNVIFLGLICGAVAVTGIIASI